MRRKKPSLYDAHEKRILQQSTAFEDFLTRKGVIADDAIEDERIRKAKQNARMLQNQTKSRVIIVNLS